MSTANKETQNALNYFGYPASTPDGVLGRKSRAAISTMQSMLHYPVTGKLNKKEGEFLISSYYRAKTNPHEATGLANQSAQGARGVLVAYRNEDLGFQPQASQALQVNSQRKTQRLAAAPMRKTPLVVAAPTAA